MSKKLIIKPELPQKNMRHAPLSGINKDYEIYEDGSIFSRMTGKWMSLQIYGPEKNKIGYTLTKAEGGLSSYSKDCLLREYIIGIPQIEGVKHVPYVHNEDYEIYDNGEIYSKKHYKFLTAHYSNTNWKFVCALKKDGNKFTMYNAKAVWESFVGPLNGKKLDFISGDRRDCSLENLKIKGQ